MSRGNKYEIEFIGVNSLSRTIQVRKGRETKGEWRLLYTESYQETAGFLPEPPVIREK